MPDSAFLDSGVVLGFCFRDDSHHYRCKNYLEEYEFSLYISNHVESEILNREPSLAEEISDGIFSHIHRLHSSSYEGQLDSMDLSRIRQNKISSNNPASASLYELYDEHVPLFIQTSELTDKLRNLARDIEQTAIENRAWLLDRTEIWERTSPYAEIDEELATIPPDDRRICLDAHDVVEQTGDSVELATVNPRDLVDGEYRELILEATSIDWVRSLANRS